MKGRLFLDLARPEDVPGLAALEAACFSHPWTERQIAEELSVGPSGTALVLRVAEGGGARVCAWCCYRVLFDEMHVLNVAVEPRWRRRGLARVLLGLALRRAARAGARTALLEVRAGNREALALYTALGFVKRGSRRDYYALPREDAVQLELQELQQRC